MSTVRSWWVRSIGELEREIRRLQDVVKHPAKHSSKVVWDAQRRLPNLKAILAARRGQKPLFPLQDDEAGKAK